MRPAPHCFAFTTWPSTSPPSRYSKSFGLLSAVNRSSCRNNSNAIAIKDDQGFWSPIGLLRALPWFNPPIIQRMEGATPPSGHARKHCQGGTAHGSHAQSDKSRCRACCRLCGEFISASRQSERLPDFGAGRLCVRLHESQWRDAGSSLRRCSCSIDTIASLLPYERYVSAETVLSMAQVPGTLGGEFRSTDIARTAGRRICAAPRPKPKCAASKARLYVAGSTGHSPLNTWPSVSTASARNEAAPFGK